MTEIELEHQELKGFRGRLMRPGDDGYEEARHVHNGLIDRHPAMIARCTCADDVSAAIHAARDGRLPMTVYGGGHGVNGFAVYDGGLCVDLRGMTGIDIDPVTATVRAEAGLTWGELDAATQAHGLALTGGRVSTTGVAGLALGSGSGWLERKLGYTCDSLFKAEVVTADGGQVTASLTENPDLFWALRGGGGNFGVVTAFHFHLHPVGPTVLGGILLYPAQAGRELVRFWRDYMRDAPDEIGSAVVFLCAPEAEIVPEPARGQPAVGVFVCYAGDPDHGASVVEPLVRFGPPAVDLVQPMPYVTLQQLLDPYNPPGRLHYWSADFLTDLPDAAVDALVSRATRPVSPLSEVILIAGGGAISRVDDDAMAFGERGTPWNIHFLSKWIDPSETEVNVGHTKALSATMKPWTTGRVYLNFIGDEGQDRVVAGFGTEKYRRLRALKAKWDPTNLFCHNQNIAPNTELI